jgi:hypothetical protein
MKIMGLTLTNTKIYLEDEEYYHEEVKKKTIYLHHTAGSHRPDWTVANWERDKTGSGDVRHIATAFVIGGISTRDNDDEWDGTIIECLPPAKWAHHLGVKAKNNKLLNKESIGIEVCNYGPLTKRGNKYYNYVNSQVPASLVVELEKEWKGYSYYHGYTENQLIALSSLMTYLGSKFDIDIKKGLPDLLRGRDEMPKAIKSLLDQQQWLNTQEYIGANGKQLVEDGVAGKNTTYAIQSYIDSISNDPFEINRQALVGAEGIWTHTNVRSDKFDLAPQEELIKMLKEL